MLHNPTLEKLEAMRLHGMAQALREQTNDERSRELSFEERFALLVDRQVTWRQNEAMQARLRRAKLRNNQVGISQTWNRWRSLARMAYQPMCRTTQRVHIPNSFEGRLRQIV